MLQDKSLAPPQTRQEPVRDSLHGRTIEDPFRWLEDSSSAEVAGWTAAQNAYTEAVLGQVPGRDALSHRLAQMLEIGTVQVPAAGGNRYLYTRRDGTQNQPVLYVREGLDGPDRVLLDPNTASAGGTIALDWWYPSLDGSLLAYGYSDHGDEKSTLRVLDVSSGAHLPDEIPHTRYAGLEWEPDGQGFYYTRYPAPGTVPAGEEDYHQHVFHHRLGTDPAQDPELFGAGRDMTEMVHLHLSPNGRWLLVFVEQGWTRSEVHVRDLHDPAGTFQPLIADLDALFGGEVIDNTFYVQTNWEAPHYRVLAIDLERPGRANWREVIAERPDVVVESIAIVGKRLVLNESKDVTSSVGVYALDGAPLAQPALPPLGSLMGLEGEWDGDDLFLGFESYTVPPTVYRYHLPSGELTTWAQVEAPIDLSRFQVERVWYPSKDGTQIPLFILSRRDLVRNGVTPTVLSGYGGFNVSNSPVFNRNVLPWLEQGGVYAMANLRGGAEYGEEWHRAGMLDKKQNVFDDFHAAAEYLIRAGYTRPERLGIMGGSNGGLLVGAALTQRPELFQAVVCQVPLLDMIRYHHFRIARLWIPEYGGADDPEQFAWLLAYSPYHRVEPGTDYPAVLFTTAESDSRVDPMHARKMAALLQSHGPRRPVLLRVETEAGHGQGKPLSKRIAEQTDIWSFLALQLGLERQDTGAGNGGFDQRLD
jgi:prolyl oligopeptidase